jgi:hypothetical protein
MDRYEHVHPKFRAWYAEQSEETRAALDAFYDATAEHPDIVPDHDRRQYARLTFTLRFAADRFGYDFTP